MSTLTDCEGKKGSELGATTRARIETNQLIRRISRLCHVPPSTADPIPAEKATSFPGSLPPFKFFLVFSN